MATADRTIRIVIDSSGATTGARRAEVAMNRVGKSGERLSTRLGRVNNALAAVGVGLGLRELVGIADAYTLVNARLRVVSSGAAEATEAFTELFDISQRTRVSLEGTALVFVRFKRVTDQFGISQERVLSVVESINEAVIVSGSTSREAAGALFQLSQGLAANALRGQELNSVLEQTPRVALAIADGLGVGIGELRKLAEQGKLTAKAVVEAIESQAEVLRQEFLNIPVTIQQSFVVLRNEIIKFTGEIGSATGITLKLAGAVLVLARNIDILSGALAALAGTAIVRVLTGTGKVARLFARLFSRTNILVAAIGALVAGFDRLNGPIKVTLGGFEELVSVWDAVGAALELVNEEIDRFTARIESLVSNDIENLKSGGESLKTVFGIDLVQAFNFVGGIALRILDELAKGTILVAAGLRTILTPISSARNGFKDFRDTLDGLGRSSLLTGDAGPVTKLFKSIEERLERNVRKIQEEADVAFIDNDAFPTLAKTVNKAVADISGDLRDLRREIELSRGELDVLLSDDPSNFFSPEAGALRDLQKRIEIEREIEKANSGKEKLSKEQIRNLRAQLSLAIDIRNTVAEREEINRGRQVAKDAIAQLELENSLLGKSLEERKKILIVDALRRELAGTGTPKDVAAEVKRLTAVRLGISKVNEENQRQRDILDKLKSPQESISKELRSLNTLYRDGKLDLDQYNKGLEELTRRSLELENTLGSGLKLGLLDIKDEFGDVAGVVRNELTDAFREAEDAIVDFVLTAKFSFEDLATSIQRSIIKIAVREQITAPLAKSLGLLGGNQQQGQQAPGGQQGQQQPLLGQLLSSIGLGGSGGGRNQGSVQGAAAQCVDEELTKICDEFTAIDPAIHAGDLEDSLEGIGATFEEIDADKPVGIIQSVLNGIESAFKALTGSSGSAGGGGTTGFLTGLVGAVAGAFSSGGGGGFGPQFTGTGAEGLASSGSFARGGSFTVGANNSERRLSGLDNRLVRFRARDGEQVTVTPPGQNPNGMLAVTVNVNGVEDLDGFERNKDQIASEFGQLMQGVSNRNRGR